MSEIMETLEIPQGKPAAHMPGARYAIDPVAFFFALVSAPVLVALMFFWIVLIPVFGLVVGGLPYLIFGTPVLLIYLHVRQGSPAGAAGCAAMTVIVGTVIAYVWHVIYLGSNDRDGVLTFGFFALIHAAAWGHAFGCLYDKWRSDVSRHPLPPFPHTLSKGPIPC